MNKERPLIGIIAAEAEYVFFSKALEIIQKDLLAADMDIVLFSSTMISGNQEFDAAEHSVYDLIEPSQLDGLIYFPTSIRESGFRNRMTERIRSEVKCPVISVDSPIDGFADSTYSFESAADMMVAHVMEHHGAKTIAFVGGPHDDFHDSIQQYFVSAMERRGYSIPENRIYHGVDWVGDFSGIADVIIADGLPDAVLCCSDLTAVQLISALADKGVNVPDDVIVTGLNRSEPYGEQYINITRSEERRVGKECRL